MVGEALGAEEVGPGLPFQGTAGKLLNRMISRTQDPFTKEYLKREDFLIANTIWCRPPDNVLVGAPYEADALEHCSPYLEQIIATRKPKAILALGNTALRRLTGHWGIDSLRGYAFDTKYGPVVGTYHPAYIGRGKWPLARVFQMDLRRALSVSREGVPVLRKGYILNPSYVDALQFYQGWEHSGKPPLAFDIETPYSKIEKDDAVGDVAVEDDASYTILRISFSYVGGEAITMPWSFPFIDIVKRLLREEGDKLVWNHHFDCPRLRANGVTFGGRIIDAMDAWHFLEPSFPMGLKYAATFYCPDMHAWKLESRERPEWYSCADSDVLLRVFTGVRADLEREGRWSIFERHFIELSGVLEGMSARGVLVDPALRKFKYDEFNARYEKVVGAIQALVPPEILPGKVYKQQRSWLEERGKWKEGRIIEVVQKEKERVPRPGKSKKKRSPDESSSGSSKKPRKSRKKTSPLPVEKDAGETQNNASPS